MTTDPTKRFDRLPAGDGPTRADIIEYWLDRFAIEPETFDGYSFWIKGADSVWVVAGDEPGPVAVETLGLRLVRTGGRHWKPTTDGVQRFGRAATRNVVALDRSAARRFVRGDDQVVEWDGDWGYLIVTTSVADEQAPLGVGLYIEGELRSQIPKARRVDVSD